MSTYNKFKPIEIGGTSNVIPCSVGNVSLYVSGGDTYLNGKLNVLGVTNDIPTSISTITSQLKI